MIDIIIQGPAYKDCLKYIYKYKSIANNIILSTWIDQDTTEFEKHNIKIIKNDYPDKPYYNVQNILMQCITTLNGILNSNADIVIKTRTDEYFENIEHVIDKFKQHDGNKIICSNIFFRKSVPYHISDHMICSNRRLMTDVFKELKYMCSTDNNYLHSYESHISPEIIICHLYLKHMNILRMKDHKHIMHKAFDIFDFR